MKKLGIYGGSFSPPHNGHFKSALAFFDSCALDELLVIPAGIPPHKQLVGDVPPEMRLKMTELAFAPQKCGGRKITVSDYELQKEGKSFTYETLKHFSSPTDTTLYLLVGSDMFLSLHEWSHPEILLDLAVIVLNRRETRINGAVFEKQKAFLETNFGAKILFPDYTPFAVSSCFLRERIAAGEDNTEFLDRDVEHYIRVHGLYGTNGKILEKIKDRLPEFLSDKRLAHVCSVEEEAAQMAAMYDIAGKRALGLRQAALLHDVTHEKSLEEQKALAQIYGIGLSNKDFAVPAVLHQFTGAFVAADLFGLPAEYASAIACHTTGKRDMSTEEKILFLADYIEKTRPYAECRRLREDFYNHFKKENRDRLLDECMLRCLECTVGHLKEKGTEIHPLTMEAQRFFKKKLVNYQIL